MINENEMDYVVEIADNADDENQEHERFRKAQSYDAYEKFQHLCWQTQLAQSKRRDLVVLYGGGLGLLISVLFDVIMPVKASGLDLWLLIVVWCGFPLAIISVVSSLLTSEKALGNQRTYAYEYFINEKEEYFQKRNPWNTLTCWINDLAVGSFSLSLFAFILLMINTLA